MVGYLPTNVAPDARKATRLDPRLLGATLEHFELLPDDANLVMPAVESNEERRRRQRSDEERRREASGDELPGEDPKKDWSDRPQEERRQERESELPEEPDKEDW